MPWSSEHIEWLVDTGTRLTTVDGEDVQVWEFQHCSDERIMSAWATHFRNHYCLDKRIDIDRRGTGLTRSEYLTSRIFPDERGSDFGPQVRSGDFGEILVSDYLQYILEFWVPRTRYADKLRRNTSTQGSDVIGFKFVEIGQDNPEDTLIIFEVKAKLTGRAASRKLQEAVNGSVEDLVRKGFSLNAIKQKLRYYFNNNDEANRIERFQRQEDKPYAEIMGAAAILTSSVFDPEVISETDCGVHPNRDNLMLIVIHGTDMMSLVHELYRRAADEA